MKNYPEELKPDEIYICTAKQHGDETSVFLSQLYEGGGSSYFEGYNGDLFAYSAQRDEYINETDNGEYISKINIIGKQVWYQDED